MKTISTHVQKLQKLGPSVHIIEAKGPWIQCPWSWQWCLSVACAYPVCFLDCFVLGRFFVGGEHWEQKSWITRSIRVLYPSLGMQSKFISYIYIYSSLGIEDLWFGDKSSLVLVGDGCRPISSNGHSLQGLNIQHTFGGLVFTGIF